MHKVQHDKGATDDDAPLPLRCAPCVQVFKRATKFKKAFYVSRLQFLFVCGCSGVLGCIVLHCACCTLRPLLLVSAVQCFAVV
jgi:hypothetical protein